MMKTAKVVLCLGTFALAVATAASSYDVTISKPVSVAGTELKAGSYSLQLKGDKATFKSGKNVVEVSATIEKAEKKYSETVIEGDNANLKEIRLGGTNMKLTFAAPSGASSAAGGK